MLIGFVHGFIAICVSRLAAEDWWRASTPAQRAMGNDRMGYRDVDNQRPYVRATSRLTVGPTIPVAPCHSSNRKCSR